MTESVFPSESQHPLSWHTDFRFPNRQEAPPKRNCPLSRSCELIASWWSQLILGKINEAPVNTCIHLPDICVGLAFTERFSHKSHLVTGKKIFRCKFSPTKDDHRKTHTTMALAPQLCAVVSTKDVYLLLALFWQIRVAVCVRGSASTAVFDV